MPSVQKNPAIPNACRYLPQLLASEQLTKWRFIETSQILSSKVGILFANITDRTTLIHHPRVRSHGFARL